jgi:hypothetical protein
MRDAIPLNLQQPFDYVVVQTLGANASGSQTLILAQDSEFDLQLVTATTSEDATTDAVPPNNFAVLMRDVTGGRDYMTAPVQRNNFAGIVPVNTVNEGRCIRFPRKQQIEFQFQNLTANPITIQLVLKGYKVFQRL